MQVIHRVGIFATDRQVRHRDSCAVPGRPTPILDAIRGNPLGAPFVTASRMARRRRVQYPGAVHHVMARGNRKSIIFEDDTDCMNFLRLLGQVAQRYEFRIYGICLMNNHYHCIGETPRGQLSDAMRFVNGVYAQSSNRRHGRTGHLFGARFRSLVVQQESYLKRVARYVALNPVRAHLVAKAEAWPWSSYRATAGLDSPPAWLCLDWLEWAFDTTDLAEAQARYRKYVNQPAARRSPIDTRAIAIGSARFREQIARAASGPKPDRPLPLAGRVAAPPPLEAILADPDQGPSMRAHSIYWAHARYGYRQSDIARHLGIDPSTVSRCIRRVSSQATESRSLSGSVQRAHPGS